MLDDRVQLMSMSFEELEDFIKGAGESAFRAKQIYQWLMRGADFADMTNLSAKLREKLGELSIANPVKISQAFPSKLDDTEKLLYALPDGNLIEGVLMRYHHGDTLCLSTQVGCRMGCAFCASTLDGCARDLTPGEMLGQVVAVNAYLAGRRMDRRVHNVVLMGSGEPLDNYDNVLKFLCLMNDPRGLNLSLRNVSLSTCGIVPKMYQLADEGLPVTLSLSLHASNDKIRARMMPIANVYSIEELLRACANYIEKTGRRVIFEYALVDGLNCDVAHADELSGRLRGLRCHVNLIPLNSVKERSLEPPDRRKAEQFLKRLEQRHISATIRREMGADIEGACGQLRRRETQK